MSSSLVNLRQPEINFLSSSFELGKAYRTINLYRSAISSEHVPIDSIPIGRHPLICKLMKGIKFRNPPRPRYHSTWDVSIMLDLFSSWPDNEHLSLKVLSFKLTALLCLFSINRVSDVKALDITHRSFTPNGVTFRIVKRTKTNLQLISYPAFPLHKKLCVVECLKTYELRTQPIRSPLSSQLLISFRKPYQPVSSPTLSRWVRNTMQMAGIDISIFGAHSVRGAISTKALQKGCSLSDIMKAADWSRESTFKTFYFKPDHHVAMSVL